MKGIFSSQYTLRIAHNFCRKVINKKLLKLQTYVKDITEYIHVIKTRRQSRRYSDRLHKGQMSNRGLISRWRKRVSLLQGSETSGFQPRSFAMNIENTFLGGIAAWREDDNSSL